MLDVLVVGSGPVGLLLTHQLRSRGLSVRLIEAAAGPHVGCRATSVQRATWRLLGHLGVELPGAIKITGTCTYRAAGQPPVRDERYLGYGCSEPELEAALRPLVGPIEYGVGLRSFTQDAEGVTALLDAGEVRCRWLVGCDGAHSTVRHLLGVAFEGVSHPEVFLVMDAELNGPFRHSEQTFFLTETDTLTALPLPGENRWSLTLSDPTGQVSTEHGLEAHDLPSVAEVNERMAFTGLGLSLNQLFWMSRFRVSTRVAARYRVGRVFLAGDAAHIQSPKGGLGMNIGLFDVWNLGWKLAQGSESWLDLYETERRGVAQELARQSDVLFVEQEEHQAGPVVRLRAAFEAMVDLADGPFGPSWSWRGPGPALPPFVTRHRELRGGLVRPDGARGLQGGPVRVAE